MTNHSEISFRDFILLIFWPVFFITLPFEIVNQYIYNFASNSPDSITFGVLGAVIGFVENIFLILIFGYGIKALLVRKYALLDHLRIYARDLVVEIFRSIGSIAVGFLLILPGFRRLVYYYFVPYVVQFDDLYEKGDLEVLSECERLFKRKLWAISGILILTQSVSFVVELLEMRFNMFTNPILWVLLFVVGIIVESYIFLVFYKFYIKRKLLMPHASSIMPPSGVEG